MQNHGKTSRITRPGDEKEIYLVTMGKIEGKRSKYWQRFKMLDDPAAWLGKNTADLLQDTFYRGKWRIIIAHVCNGPGT